MDESETSLNLSRRLIDRALSVSRVCSSHADFEGSIRISSKRWVPKVNLARDSRQISGLLAYAKSQAVEDVVWSFLDFGLAGMVIVAFGRILAEFPGLSYNFRDSTFPSSSQFGMLDDHSSRLYTLLASLGMFLGRGPGV